MNEVKGNTAPKISVILPVYNAGEYLHTCLDTLVNQTLREIEIICVLDCPTDGSDKIVQEYAEKDSRILVIKNEHNLHIGESRNVGIKAAHGEYIGFSDHDDTHELNMYESLYAATNNGQKDFVLSGKFVIETGIENNSPTLIEDCLSNILYRTSTAHITPHIFKKSFIENNGIKLIDTKLCPGEDVIFFTQSLCILDSHEQISVIPQVFYHHIDTGHNTAGTVDYASLQKNPLLIHQVYNLIRNSSYNERMKKPLWTFLVLTMYTPFYAEKRKEGVIKALKDMRNNMLHDEIFRNIVNDYSKIDKRFSLPKKLFAIWIRHALKK